MSAEPLGALMSRQPEELTAELLRRVPEVAPAVAALTNEWESAAPGTAISPDLVFGSVVPRFVVEAVNAQGEAGGKALARLLEFLEDLLQDPNTGVHTYVEVSFAEEVAQTPQVVRAIWPLLGTSLRRAVEPLM